MGKQEIAIFGATSHIAKGLIGNFIKQDDCHLHLYTRSPKALVGFFDSVGISSGRQCTIHDGYQSFMKTSHDVIINCVGAGALNKPGADYTDWFTVTEVFDNLAIGYLRENSPEGLYISFSSGAVYGRVFFSPAEENTTNNIRVNHVSTEDYYAIARLHAEAKHRAFHSLRIVDLRIFSYFSRFIDFGDGYFITEVLDALLKDRTLHTDHENIIRDYVHPEDLFSIIKRCMNAGFINSAYDVTSTRPAKKMEILEYFSSEYGLKYRTTRSRKRYSATGFKHAYYSTYLPAAGIGYQPVFSSMDTIAGESKYILGKCPWASF